MGGAAPTFIDVTEKGQQLYLQQHVNQGFCCHLLALMNARLWYGLPASTQSTEWWLAVETLGCLERSPSLEAVASAASMLGLSMREIDLRTLPSVCPVLVLVKTLMPWLEHAALLVGSSGQSVALANYRGWNGRSAVDVLDWNSLPLASNRGWHMLPA
jgi:hypothetical protein